MDAVTDDVLRLLGWIGRRSWSDQHGYDPTNDEIFATIRDRRPRVLVRSRVRRLKDRLADAGYAPVRQFTGYRDDLFRTGDVPTYCDENANERLVGVVFRRLLN